MVLPVPSLDALAMNNKIQAGTRITSKIFTFFYFISRQVWHGTCIAEIFGMVLAWPMQIPCHADR